MSKDEEKKNDKDSAEQGSNKDESRKELDDILGQLKESESQEGDMDKSEKGMDEGKSGSPGPADSSEAKEEPEGIEGILESISEKAADEPVEALNPFQRIISVFTDPARLFRYVKVKPNILLPLTLVIIFTVITGYLVYDMAIDSRIDKIEQSDGIPDDRKDIMIDQMAAAKELPRKIISTVVVGPISILVIYSVITAIFLLIGNMFLGGQARFKQIFSAYTYASLIPAVLGTIVKVPVMLAKGSIEVDLSPAVLLPMLEKGTPLYKFISSFDIFTIWYLIVFAIGFAIIYGFSKLKGILSVSIAWLLYVLIFQVWLSTLFRGFLG
ncbi:MAG: hypothetical protein EH225_10310 [Calditrichaeota bacterium]|nr:YIP1 family protein [Calditrichota bacterium]RQV92787.1 MAG: hypothetical protein EH221_10825 [bacterium]RQW00530.1 MAG: hypothetical protein EH225_10310 [Calditrichota bacterium]